ncbi:MAG: ATP-binding protein [Planctomycetota bacterium]
MIRRISTKWVMTVLAAVVVPFLGFAWFVDEAMAERHWQMVRYYLLSMAGELTSRVDDEIRERQLDIELWASDTPLTEWTIGDYDGDDVATFRPMLEGQFDRFVQRMGVYDLILAVNANGELTASNTCDARGVPFSDAYRASLARGFRDEAWFREALKGEVFRVDHHASDLVPKHADDGAPRPENFHVGFAVPVKSGLATTEVVGVVYALMNWSHIQNLVLQPIRPQLRGLAAPDIYASCYAWLWMADADTIIGHPNAGLYTKQVSGPDVRLPHMVGAARASDWGMYPSYTFDGVAKTAAFKRCATREQGGFGWIVGVGIDDKDVTTTVDDLRRVLLRATVFVLIVVVVGTILIARRTTRPILALQEHTRRIAAGDLETQIEARSRDELGDLARAFNRMTRELGDSRTKLVKAEKDAAWREMARQVAHEIKNPLTPVSLSANLLRRARDEKSPEFDAIFDRTIDLIQRQVEHMRAIAADFSAFAGTRRPKFEVLDATAVLDEVLALNAAWARELDVRVERRVESARVLVDRTELRRVLINLVSNALEAMPKGGLLTVSVRRERSEAGPEVVIEIRDTGVGLSSEVRGRLFEPYFTTRTHGTGLGLAIAARLVDEMNGKIALEPNTDGPGTIARITLPEPAA